MSESSELLTDATSTDADAAAPTARSPPPAAPPPGTGLSAMVLPELKALASSLGISGTGGMRKSQLIAAIQEKQARSGAAARPAASREPLPRRRPSAPPPHRGGRRAADEQVTVTDASARRARRRRPRRGRAGRRSRTDAERGRRQQPTPGARTAAGREGDDQRQRERPRARRAAGRRDGRADTATATAGQREATARPPERRRPAAATSRTARRPERRGDRSRPRERQTGGDRDDRGDRGERDGATAGDAATARQTRRPERRRTPARPEPGPGRRRPHDDDDGGGRRRRAPVPRAQPRRRGGRGALRAEPVISEDDVLIPVAGILDILDNYAFVRTTGYLPGPNDVYVSLAQVRKNGLRKGDVITGAVRQPREGERREKFNALVRLDTVNGDGRRSRPRAASTSPS